MTDPTPQGMRTLDEAFAAPMTRRDALIKAGAVAAVVPFASLIAPKAVASAQSGGSELRFAYTSQIDTLNPFAAQYSLPFAILQLVFPALVNQGGPTEPVVPDFATSWSHSANQLTFTFRTKTGGRWTDGKAVTARDAAFTINMIVKHQAGPTAFLASYVVGIKRAVAPNDSELILHLTRPTAPLLSNLTFIPILPEHVWAPLAKGNGAKLTSFSVDAAAVCCGPYRLAKYVQNQITIVEQWDQSYGPKPRVQTMGWQKFGSDASALDALKQNNADLIDSGITVPYGLNKLPQSSFRVTYAPGLLWYQLGFNCNPKKPRHRELLDARVRTALSHAVDKKRIVANMLYGHGQVGSTIVAPAAGKWHDSSLRPEKFDPDLANHLLDKLGYKRSAGGVRKANGQPMSYTMNVSTDYTAPDRMFQLIADGWEKVGVKLNAKILDPAAMFDAVSGPHGKYLTNDVFLWDWRGTPDPNFILSIVTTPQIGALSDSAFSNAKYDRLFEQQAHELNEAKRVSLVHQLQKIVYREKPYIVLCYVNAYDAIRTAWTGLDLSPLGIQTQSSKQWAYRVRHS